jgi:hypothetical protein
MRFDWHSFEDSFWRIQDEHQELHLSRAVDDRIEALRSFGRPRGEKNRTLERVSEDDVKEIVSCNADEIAALAAEWLDENYVAIDGRIARRDDVPVLTNKAMASMFNRVEAGYDGLPDVFPICLWDLDADVLRSFVKPYKTNDKIAAAAAAYEPVAAPEFDRFRELASHHARGLIDISSHHQTVSARHRAACAIVRDALDRRVSGHEIMMLVGRIFPKEVDKPEYAKLLERFGPPKKTRYALAEAGDGARLMFGMGQTKDGAVAETRIPRMDPADAPVVATLAARTGPAFELRRSGDEWIVPVLSDGKVGSALVRALGADADPWKETDVSRQYDLGSLQQTAAALGLIGSAVDAESRAEELVAFAANHLVEIAGIVHMRGGEPFLVQRSDRVEIRMSAPGKLDQAVKAAAAKSISYNENANVFGIPEAGLMETVALTGSYPPEGGPILTRCSVPEPGMFEVVGRHLAARDAVEAQTSGRCGGGFGLACSFVLSPSRRHVDDRGSARQAVRPGGGDPG